MAQPLRGLAPQIPNASLVWNLKNGKFTRLIDTKQVVTVGSDPLSLLTQSAPLVLQGAPNERFTLRTGR